MLCVSLNCNALDGTTSYSNYNYIAGPVAASCSAARVSSTSTHMWPVVGIMRVDGMKFTDRGYICTSRLSSPGQTLIRVEVKWMLTFIRILVWIYYDRNCPLIEYCIHLFIKKPYKSRFTNNNLFRCNKVTLSNWELRNGRSNK